MVINRLAPCLQVGIMTVFFTVLHPAPNTTPGLDWELSNI